MANVVNFFLTQVENRVCVTKRDGVFLLIVKAEPSGKDKEDKEFELTCKWNVHVYNMKQKN